MMKMNHLFLDMAVMVSIVLTGGAARHVFMNKHQHHTFELMHHHHVFELMLNEEEQTTPDDEGYSTSSSSSLRSPSLSPVPSSYHQEEQLHGDSDSIKPGSIVELYSDSSYFATPALVLQHHSSSSKQHAYVIENTITHKIIPSISSQYIHPYKPYADGTRASCNISPPNNKPAAREEVDHEEEVYMIPCVIISHTIRPRSKVVLYHVSYLDSQDELVEEILPFSREQRVHGRRIVSIVRMLHGINSKKKKTMLA